MSKPKIAIACQGGGSQTAFTAGVLHALFEEGIEKDFDIVSLSGTSGGAVCASLVWCALKKGDQPICRRRNDFGAVQVAVCRGILRRRAITAANASDAAIAATAPFHP